MDKALAGMKTKTNKEIDPFFAAALIVAEEEEKEDP